MSLLPRYLLRVFGPLFLICLGVLVSVLLMNHFIQLFQLAVSKGIALGWVLRCFGYLTPSLLSLAAPVSFFLAMLLALGQLSEDGEVLALRASGYSWIGILWPFLALSLFLSGALVYVNHWESPDGFHRFKNVQAAALEQVSRLDIEPRTFLTLGEWKLYCKGVEKNRRRLEAPVLFRYKDSELSVQIHAGEGSYEIKKGEGLTLILSKGKLQKSDPRDPRKLLTADFKRYRIFIPSGPFPVQREPAMQEMKSSAILSVLRSKDLPDWSRAELRTEFASRSVLALAPLALFWMGCALGLRRQRQGRAWGFVFSLAVLFGYYGLFVLGIGLGRRHLALSAGAPWLADAAVLCAGVYLWRRDLQW